MFRKKRDIVLVHKTGDKHLVTNCRPITASNYMFKVNNRNTKTKCEICSKLIMKTPERSKWN